MDQSFISDVVVVFTRKNWMNWPLKSMELEEIFFLVFFSILYVYDLQMRYVFRSLFVNGFVAKCPYFVVMHGRELQHTVPKIHFLSKNPFRIQVTFLAHLCIKIGVFFGQKSVIRVTGELLSKDQGGLIFQNIKKLNKAL